MKFLKAHSLGGNGHWKSLSLISHRMDMGVCFIINSHVHPAYFVAGHVMAGLACICTSRH